MTDNWQSLSLCSEKFFIWALLKKTALWCTIKPKYNIEDKAKLALQLKLEPEFGLFKIIIYQSKLTADT